MGVQDGVSDPTLHPDTPSSPATNTAAEVTRTAPPDFSPLPLPLASCLS